MKPLNLKIEGLNSFLEGQNIDFEPLCQTGLFGIFGPTGSGKSTILDAITLALYGKVERAARDTQGIINHAAERVVVEFTFEIGLVENRKKYRATRLYRRAGENNVHNLQSRLTEITPLGEIPLADKDREVTLKVAEIIGLNEDDFSKAVVLPQGKFHEFLKLKGAERNKMLQRLFRLEGYGARLNEKIKGRLNHALNQLQRVEDRLQDLGDASPEALAQVREVLAQAKTGKEIAWQNREKVFKDYEHWKEVWVVQEELLRKFDQMARLEKERPGIETKAVRFAAAERAELVRPYLEASKEAKEEYRLAVANLGEKQSSLEAAFSAVREAQDKFDQAWKKRGLEEPVLIEKKGEGQVALALEEEVNGYNNELLAVKEEAARLEEEKAVLDLSLSKLVQTLKDQESMVLSLKERLVALGVEPGYRFQVGEAVKALAEWRRAELAFQELNKELITQEEELAQVARDRDGLRNKYGPLAGERARLEDSLLQRKNAPPRTEEAILKMQEALLRGNDQLGKLEKLEREIGRFRDELVEAEAQVEVMGSALVEIDLARQETEKAWDMANSGLKEMEAALREMEYRNSAARLAEELRDNQPCPVCGSIHHPVAATPEDFPVLALTMENLEGARKNLTILDKERQQALVDFLEKQTAFKQAQDKVSQRIKEIQDKEGALEEFRGSLKPENREISSGVFKELLEEWEGKLEEAIKRRKSWLAEIETLQKDLDSVKERLGKVEQQRAGAEMAYQKTLAIRDSLQIKLGEASANSKAATEVLEKAREPLGGREPEREEDAIIRADAEGARLAEELRHGEALLIEKTEEHNKLKEVEAGLNQKLAVLRANLENLNRQRDEKNSQLNKITSGKTARELINHVQASLAVLVEREELTRKVLEENLKGKAAAEQEKAAAEEACRGSVQRVGETAEKLQEALKRFDFNLAKEVEESWCSPDQREKLGQEIMVFREQEQELKGQIKNLKEKLEDRTLTPEEWQVWHEIKENAEKEYALTADAAAIAQKEWQQAEENHTRWLDLEDQRKAVKVLISRLDLLKKIFKGDAFVEFIAKEQMENVALAASQRLKDMTRYRYALELDGEGSFIMRDDANGGVRRPVSTLSGGETFLTSLALALALSAQIQLKGQFPLEFFFLDEGFGTLDSELLENVMNTLEELPNDKMTIGVISHVPDMRQRMARRLIVEPALPGSFGSRVRFEMM